MPFLGAMAGTEGQHLRMETMQAQLFGEHPGQQIEYSVYLPDFGNWQQPSKNDKEAGTTGLSEPITALWVYIS